MDFALRLAAFPLALMYCSATNFGWEGIPSIVIL